MKLKLQYVHSGWSELPSLERQENLFLGMKNKIK